jgi:hypothetical protein
MSGPLVNFHRFSSSGRGVSELALSWVTDQFLSFDILVQFLFSSLVCITILSLELPADSAILSLELIRLQNMWRNSRA